MSSKHNLENIKTIVSTYFQDPEICANLKSIFRSENLNLVDLDDKKIMEVIKRANLMDRLYADLENIDEIINYNKNIRPLGETTDISPKNRSIVLLIQSGRAFVEYIQNYDPTQKFLIYLNFLNERVVSKPVSVSHEPVFEEKFVFDLETSEKAIDSLALSKLDAQIELAFVILNNDGSKRIYSIKQIEWRFILTYGRINLNIELGAYLSMGRLVNENKKKVSVGILQV